MSVHLPLSNKKILLGVTGGIAAYKTPELVRLLVKAGAEVRVILTEGGQAFVAPLSLETVSGHPVSQALSEPGAPMHHIDLARWADLVLVAPCSANRLAALSHGFADDLLTTVSLATEAPLWVAPAMNKQMWDHPATKANVACLTARGTHWIGPAEGEQACKEVGFGRMSEPVDIVQTLSDGLKPKQRLFLDKTILITAGPTREAIDPVRFLSNHSSGKMGYALAQKAKALGARVILISGPVHIEPPEGVETHFVETAQQMYAQAMENRQGVDIFIGTAAVADFKLASMSDKKIKKTGEGLTLACVPNPDILASMAAQPDAPFCCGFAAETDNTKDNALKKLHDKNIDMIALNAIGQVGVGFDSDTNALTVFWPEGQTHLPLDSKATIAEKLLHIISERYYEKKNRSKNSG